MEDRRRERIDPAARRERDGGSTTPCASTPCPSAPAPTSGPAYSPTSRSRAWRFVAPPPRPAEGGATRRRRAAAGRSCGCRAPPAGVRRPPRPDGLPVLDRRGFLTRVGGTAALSAAGLAAAGALTGAGPPRPPLGESLLPRRPGGRRLARPARACWPSTRELGQGGKTREHAEMLKAVWEARACQPRSSRPRSPTASSSPASGGPTSRRATSAARPLRRRPGRARELDGRPVHPGVVRGGQVYGRGAWT